MGDQSLNPAYHRCNYLSPSEKDFNLGTVALTLCLPDHLTLCHSKVGYFPNKADCYSLLPGEDSLCSEFLIGLYERN